MTRHDLHSLLSRLATALATVGGSDSGLEMDINVSFRGHPDSAAAMVRHVLQLEPHMTSVAQDGIFTYVIADGTADTSDRCVISFRVVSRRRFLELDGR